MAIDWTDPCARADALREAYYALLSGSKEQEVTYQDSGTMRRVVYASNKVDLSALRDALLAAEQECGSAETTVSKRVALRGGALRGC